MVIYQLNTGICKEFYAEKNTINRDDTNQRLPQLFSTTATLFKMFIFLTVPATAWRPLRMMPGFDQ
jgi:hypothetical protein